MSSGSFRRSWIVALVGILATFSFTPAAQALSTDATLSSLGAWSNGTLSSMSPAFVSSTYTYSANASALTTSITVQPATNWPNSSTIQVKMGNGAYSTVASYGTFTSNLNVGANIITIFVTAQDGVTTLTYTYTVTRAAPPSTDASLSSLTLSSGTLSPTFASGNITYTSTTALASITVTPTVNQANATVQVKVNSGAFTTVTSGSPSGTLQLNVGAFNYIYVQVTAQDGSTVVTYTITTTRLSTDSTLQSLTLSWPGVLSPTFAASTTAYTASVSSSTTSLTVTPAATDQTNATIQVRINAGTYTSVASWAASGSLSLNTGINPIDVKVTAQDGVTVSTYTITVTRASPPSTDATLSSLSLSSGSLTPAFASGTYLYSTSTNSVALTVTPTVSQANATIQVQVNSGGYSSVNSATASAPLALILGSNSVDVKVTAQDGSTILTYTVTVTRLSTDSTLQALNTWSSGSLTAIAPSFISATSSYTESASATTTSITVQPAATQANATIQIRINGGSYTTVASWGTFTPNIDYGANTINVLVTAQDGTSNRTYTLVVTRVALAPTGVTAVAGNTSATISWTVSAGATSYTATSSPGNFTCTSATSPCTITGLTNGTAYTFTVTAANGAGTSPSSSASAGVTPSFTLLAPTGISAVAGNTSATISWTASAGATSYTATSSPAGLTCTTTSTTCTITGLTNGIAYTFTVTASDGITSTGASSSSNTVTPVAPLAVPLNVIAVAGNTSATISWTASAGATSYTATSSPAGLTCTTTSTTCTITGLTNGIAYTFTVTAANGITTTNASSPSNAVTPVAPLAVPLNVIAVAGDTSATIFWMASAGATSYTVTSSPGNFTCTVATSSCTITGLTNGTAYTFTVTASDSGRTSPSSNSSPSITPKAPPPPPLPDVASIEAPVTGLVSADSKTMATISATIQTNWPVSLVVSLSVPVGAISSSTYFAIAPTTSTPNSTFGIVSIRVTATTSSGESITHFNRALVLNLGHVSLDATPVDSQSGETWISISRIPGSKLPKDEQEGYYITSDGSTVILTRHLTYFGVKKTQRALVLSWKGTYMAVGTHARVYVKGGSGHGARSFNVTTPNVCSITWGGFLRALSPGTCTVNVTKGGDYAYLNTSSLPLTLTIK